MALLDIGSFIISIIAWVAAFRFITISLNNFFDEYEEKNRTYKLTIYGILFVMSIIILYVIGGLNKITPIYDYNF